MRKRGNFLWQTGLLRRGWRRARLSEALIEKHKHLTCQWCLCFWISASLYGRPKAYVSPGIVETNRLPFSPSHV